MSRHMSRARRGGDGGTHWISYSDMMCSLLLMFILAITLCIYHYYTLLDQVGEQQAQLEAAQITLSQKEKDLETTRVELMGKEEDLAAIQIQLDTKEQDLAVGRIDCIWNGMSINPSREEQMNLSEPYMKNEMVFVVPASSDVASMNDLAGKNIAVQNGSSAQDILEASELYTSDTPVTVTAMATNVEALQQLELGLVDAVFLDSVVANYQITSAGKDYKVLPDGLEEEEYAIGFRKEDQALRDEVQKILGEMKADGKLGEISTKWFGSDITTVEAAQ